MDIVDEWLISHNFPLNVDIGGFPVPSYLLVLGSLVLCSLFSEAFMRMFLGDGSQSKADVARVLLTKDRRSVMKYSGKAPAGSVTRALEAAIRAPNHWLNEPWRFRILGRETIDKMTQLNEGKKEVFDQVPQMMFVTCVPTKVADADKWNVKSLEDHAATACAVQNFMISLASEGVGSKWMTGALGINNEKLMKLVDAGADEHFMGCIFIGLPAVPTYTMKVPTRKIGLKSPVLEYLP